MHIPCISNYINIGRIKQKIVRLYKTYIVRNSLQERNRKSKMATVSYPNQSGIKDTCGVNKLLNTSIYYYLCNMKLDFKSETLNLTDRNYESTAFMGGILAILQCIGGSILNFLVIWAIIRSPALRKEYVTPSILSITITDFILSLYHLPMKAFTIFTKASTSPGQCCFDGYMGLGLWSISATNLLGLAALRFIAVYFPRKTKSRVFQRSCKIVPVMCWIMSFGIIACFPGLSKRVYAIIIIIVGVLLLMLNVGTFHRVSKQSNALFNQIKDTSKEVGMKVLEREKRMGKMTALITLSFFLMYIPATVLFLIYPDAGFTHPTAVVVVDAVALFLVIIDPMVYIISHEKYREEIKLIFYGRSSAPTSDTTTDYSRTTK